MRYLSRLVLAAVTAGCLISVSSLAFAQNVVARWIQLGPASSAGATASGLYGDQPLSTTPTILARAIIKSGACPALFVDGGLHITMNQRFVASQLTNTPGTATFTNANTAGYPQYFVASTATAPAKFPDGTEQATTSWAECEAVVPAGHRIATIDGVPLKLPVSHPRHILVIADTGCRMAKANQQDCHSPTGFPFAALAHFESLFDPDLIIHVGDYFYRDTNCVVPASGSTPAYEFVTGCSDPTNPNYETFGDTFDSWNADLIYPGHRLLETAPWVMARGNHESCGRGARGWYALLDPHPFNFSNVTCAGGVGATVVSSGPVYTGDFEPSYIVPIGSVNLVVHDSSYANDSAVDANMAKNYDYDLTALLNTLPSSSYNFYVTHKPTFGLTSGATTNSGDFTEQFTLSGNATANSAFSGGVPYKVALLLSGHIHEFEYVNFSDYTHFAPQMIVGVGGDNLDPTANPDGTTPTYSYQSQSFTVHSAATTTSTTSTTVAAAYSQAEFGFAYLEPTQTGFVAQVYAIGATKAGRCVITLSPRNIACSN